MKFPIALATTALIFAAGVGVSSAGDMYPEGCVSCHVESETGDMRIGTLLQALGHKKVDRMVETVPTDCLECHSEDGGFPPLWEFIHPIHFEDPANNKFVVDYEGKCTHCHAMDVDTGEVTLKSGPKNW